MSVAFEAVSKAVGAFFGIVTEKSNSTSGTTSCEHDVPGESVLKNVDTPEDMRAVPLEIPAQQALYLTAPSWTKAEGAEAHIPAHRRSTA